MHLLKELVKQHPSEVMQKNSVFDLQAQGGRQPFPPAARRYRRLVGVGFRM